MRGHLALVAAACGILAAPGAYAWGAAGHEIVATIAQIHLHPSVFPNLCHALNYTSRDPSQPLCHLAPPSTWADKLRFKMRWSSGLHYIGAHGDYPSKTCLFPGEDGWERDDINVLRGIRNVTGLLEDWDGGHGAVNDDAANEAIKFLIHLIGDMHMPLHLTGRDRGGNGDKVFWGKRQTSLHSLWDGLLIAKAIRLTPHNYTRPIPQLSYIEDSLRGTIYDSYVRKIMWEGISGRWKDELDSWLECPRSQGRYKGASPPLVPAASTSSAYLLNQQVLTIWKHFTAFITGTTPKSQLPEETDDDLLCPYHWAAPIHALNCEIVWPPALDEPPYTHPSGHFDEVGIPTTQDIESDGVGFEGGHRPPPSPRPRYVQLDTPEYAGEIAHRWILEKLLAQAGIRLAGILNYLFAEDDGQVGLRLY